MIDCTFKPIGRAEFKLSEFLIKLKEQATQLLCDYISYRKEIIGGNGVISVRIDGKSYYSNLYADFCNRKGVNIEVIANEFSFPDSVVVELTDCDVPYLRLCIFTEYDYEDVEFNANNASTIIDTIVSLWSFYKSLFNNV